MNNFVYLILTNVPDCKLKDHLHRFYLNLVIVYAWIVPLWADQHLPQLLMEQFDALPLQCRHIEHMHEGV